jgi:hypothetical protein
MISPAIDIDWASVAVEAALSVLFCFGFGVAVGYAWRARISRLHRLVAREDRKLEKLNAQKSRVH